MPQDSLPESTAAIVLAEDHSLVAEGLKKLLEPRFSVVGIAGNGRSLLEITARSRPDVVITDIAMPELDGIEATRQLKERDPSVRVVVLSVQTESTWVRKAFEAGASGYLPKTSASAELEQAVEEVLKGRIYISPSVAHAMLPAVPGGQEEAAPEPIRVLLADDHFVARTGIHALLAQHDDIRVVGEAENGREAVELTERLQPDVILMDLKMPEMDGVAAIREILARHETARILVTTASRVNPQVRAAVRAGAVGYLHKADAAYAEAVRRAHRGEAYFPPEVIERLRSLPPAESDLLTPREDEIARLVAEGLADKEIARYLGVSSTTVRTHLSHIFDKLGLSNRVELALQVVEEEG